MELSIKFFEQRRTELDTPFNTIKADLEELADYFYPRSVRFLTSDVNKTNKKKNTKIIDSSALIALRNFSSGMMSGATNPSQNWFRMKIKNYNMEMDYTTRLWCSQVEKLYRDAFNSSQLYTKLPILYKQLGVYGFSCLSLEPDFEDLFIAKVLPIGSYKYAKNFKGEVDTLVREYTETAKNLIEQFGEDNVSDTVKRANKTTPNTNIDVVHVVMPNPNFDTTKKWAKNKKYISVYYERSQNDNKFLSMSGFDKFPYIVFESEVNGEDVYPCESPAINALPDVKQLFVMIKEKAKAVKKMVSPSLRGPAKYQDKTISTLPDTYTADDESGHGVAPIYEVNPRILELENDIQNLKAMIREHFFNDLFAMILNTAERQRTATEINELKEEKMILLAPLLLQIHLGLNRIFEWLFEEFVRVDILPQPPEQIQGGEIEIEFVSTLAQAQKVQKIAGMERFTTFTMNLANALDPALRYKINGMKLIDDYADYANIDPSQINPSELVEQMKQMEAQKQQQMEQMAALQQGSEMIKNIGGVDAIGANLAQRVGM